MIFSDFIDIYRWIWYNEKNKYGLTIYHKGEV